ncbi:hypothetical protein BXZ70DRAFT_978485 [Cristinia sonorae]|uniref:Uncharacterized protein n=1 Tax=Cristinia sonorae TaxID=1940300 RepID=A0A8K0UFR2_9AGAR|nr:hypothetical protein BXZ70DRAFT_978485 [Cristinia sonorae]
MKFTTFVLSAAAFYAASTVSLPIKRDVPANLVPQFGRQSGINPDGNGNCDGVNGPNGRPILVPCSCPPPRDQFIQSLNANVAAGHAVNNPGIQVSFPTDNSKNSQLARINAALVTLQNLRGPGVGCPASSTTFVAQQKAIQDGTAPPAPAPQAPAPPAAAPPPPPAQGGNGKPSAAQVAQLAPDLGFRSGVNPTGTGDCDGAVNGPDGRPIKIPCACPPNRADFIAALQRDVAAGFAVNNPSVKVSFPTDNSKASQSARIGTALVTLQNLNGPGKGCPAVSTTLQAQQRALN